MTRDMQAAMGAAPCRCDMGGKAFPVPCRPQSGATGRPTTICDESFDGERPLYGLRDALLRGVAFEGPADGESPLKEASGVDVVDGTFRLRYPLWHARRFSLSGCVADEGCRAAIWYAEDADIRDTDLLGPKAVRECRGVSLTRCRVSSDEFGWMTDDVRMRDVDMEGEYAFLRASGLRASDLRFSGKYSFQYVRDALIEGSVLDTKDAFWHSENVTVVDSVLRGEYLGWYSTGLTLIRCRIEGTQPLVRCERLRLVDCEMVGCDLAFEGSDVEASVRGRIDSVRDPRSGRIEADEVGEVVHDTAGGCGATIVAGGRRMS